jgi:uncharacterized SAM-binding protein YcdF (DUF218 family)
VRRKSLRWLWIAVAAVALALAFHTQILGALGSYLVHDEPPGRADVILVLAGDASGGRILKGGELVREGYAPKAIVSGPEVYGVHECELAIALAERAGYPASYFVHFEHGAHSTAEEAQDAAPLLRSMGAKHVLLVTSDFHTRRAGRIFRAAMPDIAFDVVGADDAHFTPNGWWKDREGRKTFVTEWMKTVAAWFGV